MGGEEQPDGLKLLLKLAFFVYVLGQDGNEQRMICLAIGAVIIFLAQTGRLDFVHRLMPTIPAFTTPVAPPPRPAAVPRRVTGEGEDAGSAEGGSEGAEQRG